VHKKLLFSKKPKKKPVVNKSRVNQYHFPIFPVEMLNRKNFSKGAISKVRCEPRLDLVSCLSRASQTKDSCKKQFSCQAEVIFKQKA